MYVILEDYILFLGYIPFPRAYIQVYMLFPREIIYQIFLQEIYNTFLGQTYSISQSSLYIIFYLPRSIINFYTGMFIYSLDRYSFRCLFFRDGYMILLRFLFPRNLYIMQLFFRVQLLFFRAQNLFLRVILFLGLDIFPSSIFLGLDSPRIYTRSIYIFPQEYYRYSIGSIYSDLLIFLILHYVGVRCVRFPHFTAT